jgi:hypothetical protein
MQLLLIVAIAEEVEHGVQEEGNLMVRDLITGFIQF